MPKLLLLDDDLGTLGALDTILRSAGYQVITLSSGLEGIECVTQQHIDAIISDLRLHDMSALDILRRIHDERRFIPLVIMTGFATAKDVVTAVRLGAFEVIDKPVLEEDLVPLVRRALGSFSDSREQDAIHESIQKTETHALARWAKAIVPIVNSPRDPRTLTAWGRWIGASPGAIRNWCRTAGIAPRRTLLFGRMLRAVLLSRGGRYKPEDLLDVVDRRTLSGLLRVAGLTGQRRLPADYREFLDRQVLVRDPDALSEVTRALAEHRRNRRDIEHTAMHA